MFQSTAKLEYCSHKLFILFQTCVFKILSDIISFEITATGTKRAFLTCEVDQTQPQIGRSHQILLPPQKPDATVRLVLSRLQGNPDIIILLNIY